MFYKYSLPHTQNTKKIQTKELRLRFNIIICCNVWLWFFSVGFRSYGMCHWTSHFPSAISCHWYKYHIKRHKKCYSVTEKTTLTLGIWGAQNSLQMSPWVPIDSWLGTWFMPLECVGSYMGSVFTILKKVVVIYILFYSSPKTGGQQCCLQHTGVVNTKWI